MSARTYSDPMSTYVVYSQKDRGHFRELEKHLSVAVKQQNISLAHHGLVAAGTEKYPATIEMLDQAHIIVLLISPDFIASEFCYDDQMANAMKRHEQKLARVIPVIVRPCDWKDLEIARLQCIPLSAKPITRWKDSDLAWTGVAKGIRASIQELRQLRHARQPPTQTPPLSKTVPIPDSQSAEQLPPDVFNARDVRKAYRYVNNYHRHLFDIVHQVFQDSLLQLGVDPAGGWSSHLFDLPVRRDKLPIFKWVHDFQPLAHAHIWWATDKTPRTGGIRVAVWHCGDSAVEDARETNPDIEPVKSTLKNVDSSTTKLGIFVQAVIRLNQDISLSDWNSLDSLIEASEGFNDKLWFDGKIHDAVAAGLIRYGGFEHHMDNLPDRNSVDKLLVEPLRTLIAEARKR